MRHIAATLLLIATALPAWSNARVTLLTDAMQLRDVIAILREEGLAYGVSLDATMLEGRGGAFWQAQVSRLYDVEIMEETLRRALEQQLAADDIDASFSFFSSDTGTAVVTAENTTRRAFADPDIKVAAYDLYSTLKDSGDATVAQVSRYIAVNDLIDHNVSGAMSEQYSFLKGLADGGYSAQTDNEIVEEVWLMRDDIATETEEWLNAFLVLAYQTVGEDDLVAYVDFAASDAGSALNAALFIGFDQIYKDIAYGLGRAIALSALADEI